MSNLCAQYADLNTSSLIFTYILGSTILMTRDSECMDTPLNNSEGSWKIAKGVFLKHNSSLDVRSEFGFHETGELYGNRVYWSNGAIWSSSMPSEYYKTNNGMVQVTENDKEWGVYNMSNVFMGTFKLDCNKVYYNNSIGQFIGKYIVWDDYNVWKPSLYPEVPISLSQPGSS